MNWNEIENLVNEHRDRFDEANPSSQHRSLFEAKLKEKFKKTGMFSFHKLSNLAASIGILILCSCVTFFIYSNLKSKTSNPINVSQTTAELKETEKYYTKQINHGLKQIETLKLSDPKQKKAIMSDLNSMDRNYEQLKRDQKENPNDERLAHAIIEHYQVKLEAIDQIINSISFSQNNLKPVSHEQNM